MKPTYLVLDTLDDRREIHGLLARLPPAERVRFLERCCKRVPADGAGRLPVPSVRAMRDTADAARRCERSNERLTTEVYADLLSLAANYRADLAKFAVDLERRVKEFERGR